MTLRNRLRGEDGIALIVSLIVLSLFLIIGATVINFSTANERDSARSRGRVQTHANAEGGVAAGLSRIYQAVDNPNPTTGYHALNPTILPASLAAATNESGQPVEYENGYAYYWGELNPLTGEWTVHSNAHERNPNGTADIVRNVSAKLTISTQTSTTASTDAWNWIYARHEGYDCDLVIQNPGDVVTNVWAEGNLCVENTATLMGDQDWDPAATNPPQQPPTVVVEGNLTLRNPQNEVGSATEPVATFIGGWCQYRNNPQHDPCQGPTPVPWADHVWSLGTSTNLEDMPSVISSITGGLIGTFQEPAWPDPTDPDIWTAGYLVANPGPYYPCAMVSGTPPTFDNDAGALPGNAAFMNGSVGVEQVLTPSYAYTCRTAAGELSWVPGDPGTLTVRGTIFIDGDATIPNNIHVDYNGQGVIYVQGDLLMKKAIVCASYMVGMSQCDNSAWNPDNDFLLFVVGEEAEVGPHQEDVDITSTTFQGGLMARNDIDVETTSQMAGPMLGNYLFVGQTAGTSFPTVDLVPTGTPGEPMILFTASSPKIYG